ncbi:MAG: hypothetical protein PHH37_07800 [Paludibacter sp.]|nr:hypothetical protein [Paludibacter sp.]
MNILKFIGLLVSKLKYLIMLPVIAGLLVFLFTMNIPKQYTADTTIYTGVTSNSGLDVSAAKVDKLITQNEYNNIMSIFKSSSLFQEVSLRLLAQHLLLKKATPEIISEENFRKIQKEIPDDIKKLAVKNNEQKTYENLCNYIKQSDENFLYRLLNYEHPLYSIKAISKIKVEQVNSSDIFKLTYQSCDPGVCYNTVKIAADVFVKTYGQIKRNLKSSAVDYFQKKLEEIAGKLDETENQLLSFNVDNNIINYDEQTKQVTTQHEEIELRLQTAKMNYEASAAVLKKLEAEIAKRFAINLQNINILRIRSELVDCNNSIATYQVSPEKNKEINADELYNRKKDLEQKLQLCLDSIYSIESTSQGVESQKVLSDWLDAVTNFETNKAMFKSMQDRNAEFMLQFKRYAPLGATIKRIEREINVYENEYLNILNNLNAALQNEQNTDIISNMRIIDPAKFPISSIPSKRKLYLIIAVLMTLIFYIAGLFIIELLDNRIKCPSFLSRLTGLEIAGAYSIENNRRYTSEMQVAEKANNFIFEKIRNLFDDKEKYFVIQLFSNWSGAGKNLVAVNIFKDMKNRGYSVGLIDLATHVLENVQSEKLDSVRDLRAYYDAENYDEYLSAEDKKNDFVIVVMPPISKGIDNSRLIKSANINFVVFDANLTWTAADQYNIDKLKSIIGQQLYPVLTNAIPENLEEIYGEIPKKRSKLRVLIKKLLQRFVR